MVSASRTPPFRAALAVAALIAWVFAPARAAAPIETTARYAVIMDFETGEVLYEKNADAPTAPASMSKLMTVAVTLEKLQKGEISLDDPFAVSKKAWKTGGSKMWVRVDTEIAVGNLLRGAIVQSGNDACVVLAENIAGSEDAFADLMNKKAREWGLDNSRFANATGLPDPEHLMSTRDLAALASRIIREYGAYYPIFAEREFTWEKIRQENRNPILKAFEGADGLKTGHTDESGYGLVASATRGEVRRIVVLNGLEDEKARARESARMLRIAFDDFVDVDLFGAGDRVGEAQVFAGREKATPLVVREPISTILHRAQRNDPRATIVYEGPLTAPVSAGDQVGFLRVALNGETLREAPVYAGDDVAAIGVVGRIVLAAKKLLLKPEHFDGYGDDAATPQE